MSLQVEVRTQPSKGDGVREGLGLCVFEPRLAARGGAATHTPDRVTSDPTRDRISFCAEASQCDTVTAALHLPFK